jgi:hypothetical protein
VILYKCKKEELIPQQTEKRKRQMMKIYEVTTNTEKRYFTEEKNAREFAKYFEGATILEITPITNDNNQITWWKKATI